MEKNTIFQVLIIFAMILVVSVGCGDLKSEKIDENFWAYIDYPILQEVFTKGL